MNAEIKSHGQSGDSLLFTTEMSEGTCLIEISVTQLRSICAVAKGNKSKRSHDGPITVKYYRTSPLVLQALASTEAKSAWERNKVSTAKLNFPTPLTEKHRPLTIEDFVGLHKPKKVLEAFVARPFESAWLFVGPSGIGKTTMAMAIAEQINAELHHIPSRQCDIDTVAAITHQCQFAAFNFSTGKAKSWHLVLCDEADTMTNAAQNCLLSKLDSTAAPPKTIWIFTANSTTALEDRFLSRCRVLNFEHESLEGELEAYLTKVYRKEGGKHPLSVKDICKASSYNVRDALMKLEIEVMMGPDRSDLPPEKELEIVEEHPHSCPKCGKPWKHAEPLCKIPYRSECQPCGGAMSNGQFAAKKAWQTIRANIAEELKNGGKKKRKKRD